MSFLLASNIVLWIAVIGLALVNYALLRQVGVLFERVAPAGALMVNRTLEVGAQAPALEALTLSDERVSIGVLAANRNCCFLCHLTARCVMSSCQRCFRAPELRQLGWMWC